MSTLTSAPRQFPCSQCGAALIFQPETETMVCEHCGARVAIPQSHELIEELDYDTYAASVPVEEPAHEKLLVRCTGCGAETHLGPNVTADKCVFCGSPVVAEGQSKRQIKPRALLPFLVARKQAEGAFRDWLAGLWFAPGDLKKKADVGGLVGVYVPSWTYRANVFTRYSGERGDDYQESESYTDYENGKPVTRTRMVTKTRWYSCSGNVQNQFQNLLVLACTSLPPAHAAHLEPWDLNHLVPYADEFLSGFAAESYQIDLCQGFEKAKEQAAPKIRNTVERDIGGDHQKIFTLDSEYSEVKFKHILLPLWISAYFYAGKSFRFLVNARSGAVRGERPYSAGKITVAVIAGIILLIVIMLLVSQRH